MLKNNLFQEIEGIDSSLIMLQNSTYLNKSKSKLKLRLIFEWVYPRKTQSN